MNIAHQSGTHTGLAREASMPIKVLVAFGEPIQENTTNAVRVFTQLALRATDSGEYVGGKGHSKLSDLVQHITLQARVYTDTIALLKGLNGVSLLTRVG